MERCQLWLITCAFLLSAALPRAVQVARHIAPASAAAQAASRRPAVAETTTPITHVIVIIGENRSFDHVYATYTPRRGERVSNLLAKGIVNADGSPGPHHS